MKCIYGLLCLAFLACRFHSLTDDAADDDDDDDADEVAADDTVRCCLLPLNLAVESRRIQRNNCFVWVDSTRLDSFGVQARLDSTRKLFCLG